MNIGLLKNKNFSILILAKLVSLIGTQMQNFALSLYVLKTTGSATKFASVLAITIIPQLILGPMAGVLADWFDRKKIMIYLDILSGIAVGLSAVVYKINGYLPMSYIYILAITLSMISLLYVPAISTVIPTVIKKEELADANGVNSFIMNLGNLAAPAIAGVLLAFYSMFLILIINAVSFVIAAIGEIFINMPKLNKKPEKINVSTFSRDFLEGIKYIKSNKLILNIIILALIINFAFTPILSLGLTYISKQVIKITDSQYGVLESILVISTIIAPFVCSRVAKKFKTGKLIFYDIFLTTIFIALMAMVSSPLYINLFKGDFLPYISLMVVGFGIGLIVTVGNIALNTMFQQEIPLDVMGRVYAVMGAVCTAAIPLGQMLFGFLFDKIDAWICVTLSAAILLITILSFKKSLCNQENRKVETSIDNEELNVNMLEIANIVDNESGEI